MTGTPEDTLLFVGLSNDVFGFAAVNGAVINNYNMPNGISFSGSPAVAPWGTVYIVGSNFNLFALDFAVGGSPLWTYSAFGSGTVTAPAVHNSLRAIFYSIGSSVLCINETGVRVWMWTPPITQGGVTCSTTPAIDSAGKRVFVGCNDYNLYALNATTGILLWSRLMTNTVSASPAVSADGALVFVSSNANNLQALWSDTGALAWIPVSISQSAVAAAPAVARNAVIVATTDGTLFAANNTYPGSVKWSTILPGGVTVTAPVTLDNNGTAFVVASVGSMLGYIFGVDVETGALLWTLAVNEPLSQAAVLLPSGVLVVPSQSYSAIYVIRGFSATATPTASGTASATASASATRTMTSTSTWSMGASPTSTSTASNSLTSTSTSTASSTATATSNTTSGGSSSGNNGGGNLLALDTTSTIALSASVPVAIILVLGALAWSRGLLQFGGGNGGAQEWKGAGTGAGAPLRPKT
jgi:outer membrane protein assembly factor BamB